jgi:hypothetical protein
MIDEKSAQELQWVLRKLEIDPDQIQSDEVRVARPLHAVCRESGDPNLEINVETLRYRCADSYESGTIRDLKAALDRPRDYAIALPGVDELAPTERPVESSRESFSPGPVRAIRPVLKTEPNVLQLRSDQALPTPEEIKAEREIRLAEIRAEQAARRRGSGEKVIVAVLAVVFVIAGLMASAVTGFANYHAFSSSVSDPIESMVWGTAGIIAAIVSFGGFTFVYWHAANKRVWESLRSLVFALIGAGASILGTQMYISSNNLNAASEVTSAASNRELLQTQVADWRRQLEGIPPETRSVEGLEAYIAEVERVGRTEQKPYRDAQNELGLAKRRDELTAKIEAANTELLGQGSGDILLQAEQRAALPSWLFAVLLELFASQATSIGLVALLILTGRRGGDQSASG